MTSCWSGLGEEATSLDVFRDWLVANYLNEPDGRYSSEARNARSAVRVRSTFVGLPRVYEREVAQFGAHYYVVTLPADELVISFNGDPAAELFPVAPRSGEACWWSNDGDGIDTTLTRRFDLTGVDTATLRFHAWHDIEEDWDFAYVEVSEDNGGDVDDPRNDAHHGRKSERDVVRARHHRGVDRMGGGLGRPDSLRR